MRVLFVITSLGAGGTERSTALLLPLLRERGIEPTVVGLVRRDVGDEQAVVDGGFDVRFLGSSRFAGRVRELRSLLRELEPAVLHTAVFDADQVGRLAAVGTGVPVLGSLVNTPYVAERLADPNISRAKLRAVRAIDATTARTLSTHFHAVTEGVAADAVTSLGIRPERITVVERGRDPEVLGPRTATRRSRVRTDLGLDQGAEMILAVGRQEHQKGHVHLIEALALLADERPDAVVVIAGRTGNATAALEDAIIRTGLSARVHRLGHRDDVADLLCAADVFALPSRYEGTAGAAIEALALETPVVATDLAGTRGVLIDGHNARLVPVGEPSALALALASTLDEPAEAAGRARRGRVLFEERFTLSGSADRMVQLYTDVAARGRRGVR